MKENTIQIDTDILKRCVQSIESYNPTATVLIELKKLLRRLPKVGETFVYYGGPETRTIIVSMDGKKFAAIDDKYSLRSDWFFSIEELCEACSYYICS